MKRLVMKFGGTSLMNTKRIRTAAEIAAKSAAGGYQVIVVVSAMGHTTDQLLGLAQDLSHEPAVREVDSLLVTGEQVSAALMTIAIQSLGLKARSFTGQAAGILTEKCFGNARIEEIRGCAIERCLDGGMIPVVAGFQGATSDGELTTLGRGGSDTTAIALAAFLRAERCDIYSDVNGVYSADPHILEDAFRLPIISYEDMYELAVNGAQVLNPRSVELAMKQSMPVRVRSTFAPNDAGTLVTRTVDQSDPFISIASKDGKMCVRLTAAGPVMIAGSTGLVSGFKGWKEKVSAMLSGAGIHAELGTYPYGHDEQFAFSIPKSDCAKMKAAMLDRRDTLDPFHIKSETGVVSLSLVGSIQHSYIQMQAIDALATGTIPIELVLRSRRRLALFVPETSGDQALRLLHANLCLKRAA